MASLLVMGLGAILNATAFIGGNYLANSLSHHDANAERRRHDMANEKLQKAQVVWHKQRQQRLDYINNELKREQHAEKTFKNIDAAMQEYYLATQHKLQPLPREPQLYDFYHPREQQKTGEIVFIIGGIAASGYAVYKYL